MEAMIGIWVLIILLIIVLALKFKVKFDVIYNKTEKHYVIWYSPSKYHEREYMILFSTFK
jgi:hypothetical protein